MNIANPRECWSEESRLRSSESKLGKKHSEKTKKKISESQIGKEVPSIQVKIVQISKFGELIKIWDSIKKAKKELGININLNRKTSGGFQWQRYNEYIISPKCKLEYINIRRKTKQCSLITGNLIKIWDSMNSAAKSLGIRQGDIANCISGRQKSAGGFIWK
jgi:hypothetical protein